MDRPEEEPRTAEAVRAWVDRERWARDPFRKVADATSRHREEHDCDTYPSSEAPLMGTLTKASGAGRILEVGCGLGYSALWLAYGSAPDGRVETVEKDALHAELAGRNFERHGYADRISILRGTALEVSTGLDGPYDFIYYDAEIPHDDELSNYRRLLRPGGVLVSSNLFLGQYVPDLPGLEEGARYRRALLSDEAWLTAFAGEKAVSIKRA